MIPTFCGFGGSQRHVAGLEVAHGELGRVAKAAVTEDHQARGQGLGRRHIGGVGAATAGVGQPRGHTQRLVQLTATLRRLDGLDATPQQPAVVGERLFYDGAVGEADHHGHAARLELLVNQIDQFGLRGLQAAGLDICRAHAGRSIDQEDVAILGQL